MYNMSSGRVGAVGSLKPLATDYNAPLLDYPKFARVMNPDVITPPGAGSDFTAEVTSGSVFTFSWYLPTEATNGIDHAEATAFDGDRWNKGGSLAFFAGITEEDVPSADAEANN